MSRNSFLWPCYYRDWRNLVEFKKIYYYEYLDYSERLSEKGFCLYRIGCWFYLFKLWEDVANSYKMNLL